MKFYHATSTENMERIAETGIIKKSWDGVVYLCKDPIDACKFLILRGLRKMCVIETERNEEDVEESFDHSQAFFRCRAYMHKGDIRFTGTEKVEEFTFDL